MWVLTVVLFGFLIRSFCWWSSCVWLCYLQVWSVLHCQVSHKLMLTDLFFSYGCSLKEACASLCFLPSVLLLSVGGSLDDVSLDGQCDGSRAVHSSQRSVCLLAVYTSRHSASVLDATGKDGHPDQSPRVDAHGRCGKKTFFDTNYSSLL